MPSIQDTLEKIRVALKGSRRPALLWSGGKDSTALLHLARQVMPEIECIQWQLPWMKQKWDFHNKLAAEWGLTVHDSLPLSAAICHGNGRLDVMESYSIGSKSLVIARGTEPYEEGAPYACGREWLERPKAAKIDFPWDLLLCGHKSDDTDPLSGPIPLNLDLLEIDGSASISYPLRDWTDRDVTAYLVSHGIQWDSGRYDLIDGVLTTKADKHLNSDYYHACFRCLDRREGAYVACPKRNGAIVANISEKAAHYEPRFDYCNLRTEGCTTANHAVLAAPTSGHGLSSGGTGPTPPASTRH
jgi:hypothetical protein